MNVLAFETAADPGCVALWCDGRVTERRCPDGLANSATLLPEAVALMREAGLDFSDIDGLAFGSGPGSFTGLRVACGVAQGLSVARDIPLLGVGTLEAMALECGGNRVLVALDARMGEVYGAFFEHGQLSGEYVVCAPDALPIPDGTWAACGNGLSAYPVLVDRLAQVAQSWRPEIAPSAAAVARLAAARLAAGERLDPADAAPLYVRDKVAKTVAERLAEGGKA